MKGRLPVLLAVAWGLAHAAAGAGQEREDGLHMLAAVQGKVEVKRKGGSGYVPGTVGMAVRRGDLVRLDGSAQAKVVCADLKQHELPAGRLSGIPCDGARPVLRASDGSLLNPTRAGEADGIPVVVAPRRTKLLDPRPVLRWEPMPGVDAFKVGVRGPEVDWSTDVRGATSAAYPQDAPALKPGATYKVVVVANGRSSEEASEPGLGFTLLGAEEAQAVRGEAERIRSLGLDGNAEKLLIAHLHASHGLDAEAIALLEELAMGSKVPAALRALGDLYGRAGLYHLAEERYLKAAQLSEEAGDREGQALARQALGVLYREALGLEDEAKRAFGAALELFRALGDATAVQQIEEQLKNARDPL